MFTGRKICLLILIYKFVPVILLDASHKYFIDYSENVEFIQELTGHDVKLQCNLDGLLDQQQLTHEKVQWFFKQCSDTKNEEIENCQAAYAKDWTQLPCEQQFCQQSLILRNVTEKYSGYYKCTVQPQFQDKDHKLDIKLVRTFQLDIQNRTSLLPEFVSDYPQNRTALEGNQVVLQCRVHSEEHPTIRWFKRLTADNQLQSTEVKPAHIVQYNGYNYKLLNTAKEKLIDHQVYLSKLILNNVQVENEGYYACVAISYRGYSMRESYLQIATQEWNDYHDETEEQPTNKSEFWLLFLMPVGLALLPLSFWLSYCVYKHLKKKSHLRKWSLQCSDEETGVEHFILHN